MNFRAFGSLANERKNILKICFYENIWTQYYLRSITFIIDTLKLLYRSLDHN